MRSLRPLSFRATGLVGVVDEDLAIGLLAAPSLEAAVEEFILFDIVLLPAKSMASSFGTDFWMARPLWTGQQRRAVADSRKDDEVLKAGFDESHN